MTIFVEIDTKKIESDSGIVATVPKQKKDKTVSTMDYDDGI